MGKRKVLTGYAFLFIVMILFIAVQIARNEHFVGYTSFVSQEEQVVVSEQEGIVLSFREPLVLGRGTGKNLELFVEYYGQTPLVSCGIADSSSSSIHISSSQHVSLHPGEKITLPVSILVPADFSSTSRNLSLLFSCEGYQYEYEFSFTILGESLSSSSLTSFAVQEETKSKLSLIGFIVIGILIVIVVARLFYKRDTQNYVSLGRPRRTLIPFELS